MNNHNQRFEVNIWSYIDTTQARPAAKEGFNGTQLVGYTRYKLEHS